MPHLVASPTARLLMTIWLVVWCHVVHGEENPQTTAANAVRAAYFERHIRPVLVKHCYQCHSTRSQPLKGGLALDSAAGLQAGGDSGEVVSAGQPEDSLLLSALRHDALEMPPKKRLPQVTIDRFAHWIEQGAYYPGAGSPPADSVAS